MEAVGAITAVLELLLKAAKLIKGIKGEDEVVKIVNKAIDAASHLLRAFESIDDKDKDKEYLDAVDDASQEIKKLLNEFVAGGELIPPLQWITNRNRAKKLLEEIAKFNSELDSLYKDYLLTTTIAQREHNVGHKASIDKMAGDVTKLINSLEQGAKHGDKTATSSSDERWTQASKGANECVAHDQEERNVLALVKYMRESADADQAEQAAWALCEMAENEKTSGPREAIKWVNAVSKLVEVLEAGPKVADSTDTSVKSLRLYTVCILRRLALSTADNVQTVVAGVVPWLAKMLSCTGNAEIETTVACAALANIAMQAKHKQIFLQTTGLIELLIKLIRRGSAPQKKYAANTLRELATDQECAEQIRILHGVTALIDLLYLGHSTDPCSSTLGALWNLAAHPENRTEIAAVGGVKAIVDQIRPVRTEEQRQLAASTLAVLAKDDKNDVLIGEAGGVKILVDLFCDGTIGQKNSAVSALAELANNEANATAMVDAEVARPLLAAFRSGTDIERSKAGAALAWIAKFTKDKADLVAKVGLDSIVSLLSGSTDEKQCSALMIAGISKDEDIQQKLGELHVIEKLIELAQNDDDGAELMKPALDALCALSEDNDENRVQIEDADGIKVFVRLLSKLKQSEKGSTEVDYVYVVEALKIIASTANLKRELINADALKMFLIIMESGSMVEKQCTAAILTELIEVISEDDRDGRLELATGAFISVLREKNDKASQLTATVLRGLRWLAGCECGRVALRKNRDVCQILVHMLTRKTCNTKRLVGSVLASLAGHIEFAEVLVDAGVIGAFKPLLGDENRLLKRAGIRGLVRLASHEVLRHRIASTPRVCERIVKLLNVPTVQNLAAEALSLLASQSEIAVKFGQLDGVKELVTLLKKGTPSGKTHAMQALTNLSNAADNIAHLTKIGAIEAAIAQDAAALKFLKNMSADPEAAATMKAEKVVAKCVAACVTALGAKDSEQRVTSLKILTNLNDFQTTSDSTSYSESDNDSNSDSDNDSDSGSDSYSGSDDDDSDCNFLQLIIDKKGVKPLLKLLSKLQQGKRAGLVKLLHALAMVKRSTKDEIGTEIHFFVTIIHKGTPEEQLVAAAAVTTLVKKCRKNARRMKGAHASTAFVKLVRTHKDREKATDLTRIFLINLESLKSAYPTKVVERTVKALVSLAKDLVQGSDTARELLLKLVSTAGFDGIVVSVNAIAACANLLKKAIKNKMHANSEPVEQAVRLLGELVQEKYCSKIVASGAVDSLVKLLKSSPAGTREEIAKIILRVADEDDSQCEAIGELGCIQVFLEMIQSGTPGEKSESVAVLGSLCDEHPKNLAQLLPEEMIKVCDEMLQTDDADMQFAALSLVESLAKDTSVGPLVASQEKVVKRTVELLNSEFVYPHMAIHTITALAAHSAACSVFADAGVKKKLKNYEDDELACEAGKALKAIRKTSRKAL